ncbi:hypothetical protein N7447_009460 [Penicillium robsamsonii]|uniref:uncharacterized protein n=1 Tax=Penicillium robsamsonii TaxID=1792511 RepID=UPI0025496279|nr:uncharacterized protein N7447_009460 [Penicillium robsamsonii]KAJ5817227.1 hypothetical protein N7447_009460 [Penicillium robsamsonii]
MTGVVKGLGEVRETPSTMGEAWKRLTKRSRKGKGRMESDDDHDTSQADDDGDSAHRSWVTCTN